MILLDSSILIRYFRTGSPAILEVFKTGQRGVSGVTRAEILHGARSSEDATRLREALAPFVQVAISDVTWDTLGDHLALLRKRGLGVPFQDALLATIALEHDAELWTDDNHFSLIREALPALRLFVGPQ